MAPTNNLALADAAEREAVLDPGGSFIVQAPAGSGKTELLIQRFLGLLAGVKAPEEIVAITFTRKAAAEMRSRILRALERAEDPGPPDEAHERRTWRLARSARARNQEKAWQLTKNPSRFRIQTIDALCAAMARQMPFLSRLGAPPEVSERPQELYRQASRETVAELETGAKWSPAIEALIRHLDNQLERVERLIAEMLAKRDQWLRHIALRQDPAEQRRRLENALQTVIVEALENARLRFPKDWEATLIDMAGFASANLAKEPDAASPIIALKDLDALPGSQPECAGQWLGLCELLLTREGKWRQRADKNLGFPAPSSAKKNSALKNLYAEKKSVFTEMLTCLADDPSLADRLDSLRCLPQPVYADEEWDIMRALFEILRLAVAHLELVFQSAGEVDFAEVSLRAAQALGAPENPTDLALSLDYQVRHILIDEFQDTSITQFELLEKMTMGWQPGDGRTFFAVGDPMQSIYGFREAQVGLFLKAWQEGLGPVALHSVRLTVNFRSQQRLVEWANQSFPLVMPPENDAAVGAVAYSPADAAKPPDVEPAVRIHPTVPPDRGQEAEIVLECIQEARRRNPDGSIAVLVRSRPHLETILKHLKSHGVSFTALEIESLKNRPVIQDLLSLTRALSHPLDCIAWLAVLRAPWCGLSLNDMYLLADGLPQSPIVKLLDDPDYINRLSADGRVRAQRVRDILMPRLLCREQRSLRRMVEGAWLLLGGPACCFSEADFEDARAYLDLLDQDIGNSILHDIEAFESAAADLFAQPDPQADEKLQVMTIHKAKGLEFDTVILPALDKYPPSEVSPLLLWLERSGGLRNDLLLAPIAEYGREASKTYDYIRQFEKRKRAFEDSRLLYVAVTRAKERLHLLGGAVAGAESGKLREPNSTSLLYSLWPVVAEIFENAAKFRPTAAPTEARNPTENPVCRQVPYIRRLSDKWQLPAPPMGLDALVVPERSRLTAGVDSPPFDWAGEVIRRMGTVIHEWLKTICEDGVEKWTRARVAEMRPRFYRQLKKYGIRGDKLDKALLQVNAALVNMLDDPMGRWILSRHRADACEYGLTGRIDGKTVGVVIDRTFIDEVGVRWIIDYKSSVHKGGSLGVFLDQEKDRYREQMQFYARVMAAMENRSIRLMLYFPQLMGYREWAAGEE